MGGKGGEGGSSDCGLNIERRGNASPNVLL